MRRCISSGRIPATCTGNQLLGAFSQMVGQVLPSAAKEPPPGPEIAGVFEGAGGWRLDFIDGGVLVNCSVLAPDQHGYTFDFKNNRAAIVIDTTPKPLVLTLGPDGTTMTGSGSGRTRWSGRHRIRQWIAGCDRKARRPRDGRRAGLR